MIDQAYMKDEISLWKFIDLIVQRKKIVVTVFFVTVVITVIVGLCLPKIYQATAYITIVSSETKVEFPLSQTDEYLEQVPSVFLPLAVNKALLTSDSILEGVINKLKLTDESGQKSLKVSDLSGRLDVRKTQKAGILWLEAEYNNPKTVKGIVNAWTREYVRHNREIILREIKKIDKFFATDQFKIVEQGFARAKEQVKDFNNKYKVELRQAALKIKTENLYEKKAELINLESALKEKDAYLRELKKVIEKQAIFSDVSEVISDDNLLQKKDNPKRLGGLDGKIIIIGQINPMYQDLEMRIVNAEIDRNVLKSKVEYLKGAIEITGKEIDELEKNTDQSEFKLAELTRQVKIYEKPHNGLSAQIEKARFARTMQLGELKIISLASEPQYPVRPKIRRMITISAVGSLMLGIFLAFSIECWQSYLKKP